MLTQFDSPYNLVVISDHPRAVVIGEPAMSGTTRPPCSQSVRAALVDGDVNVRLLVTEADFRFWPTPVIRTKPLYVTRSEIFPAVVEF